MHCDIDMDVSLEYDDSDFYHHFIEFYKDVLPEFDAVGKVIQFKVSCNYSRHLRGNVYVQYGNENEATEAFRKFNARWYSGRQLQCSFTSVNKWKPAICGMFHHKKCPKGRNCNFLHVFQNPDKRFYCADNDIQPYYEDRASYRSNGNSSRRSHRSERSERSKSPSRSSHSHKHSPDRRKDRRQSFSRRSRSPERVSRSARSDSSDIYRSRGSRSPDRQRSRNRSPEYRSRRRRSKSPKNGYKNMPCRRKSRSPDDEHRSLKKSRSPDDEYRSSRRKSRSPEHGNASSHRRKYSRCGRGIKSPDKTVKGGTTELGWSSDEENECDKRPKPKKHKHKKKKKACQHYLSPPNQSQASEELLSCDRKTTNHNLPSDNLTSNNGDWRYCKTPSNYEGSSPEASEN